MLEPRLMEVSLWLFPGLFVIVVLVGIPTAITYYLRYRRGGYYPRKDTGWTIAYFVPTMALFAWLVGFGLLESAVFGLLAIPLAFISAELGEGMNKLVERNSDEHRDPAP